MQPAYPGQVPPQQQPLYPQPGVPPQQPYQAPYPPQPTQPYTQPSVPQPGYAPPGYQPVPQQATVAPVAVAPVAVAPVAAVPAYGVQYVFVTDPMAELALSTGVLIKQEEQFFEQFAGCEMPNRYYVFSQSPQGGMKLLFICKEFSDCCARNCCPANTRELSMKIKHVGVQAQINDDYTTSFVTALKPFKFTCACFERPVMRVSFTQGGQPVGKVKQPFTCCDPEFEIFDNAGSMRYFVHADCCQCGLLCANNFCGKMSEAYFQVYSSAARGVPVGRIFKKVARGVGEILTSADSYQIDFPQGATPQDKLLLIVTGLMIDYQFFEQSANDNKSRQHQHHHGGKY